jgi:hypothetical protein
VEEDINWKLGRISNFFCLSSKGRHEPQILSLEKVTDAGHYVNKVWKSPAYEFLILSQMNHPYIACKRLFIGSPRVREDAVFFEEYYRDTYSSIETRLTRIDSKDLPMYLTDPWFPTPYMDQHFKVWQFVGRAN